VRVQALALVAGLAAAPGCASTYPARDAPLGDPGWPAAHADGLKPFDRYTTPGWYAGSGSDDRSATVTRAGGFEVRDKDDVGERNIRWDIRLQGGEGTDIHWMMWSAPTAPRCQGGHPARDILLDLDAPPNHPLAPDHQVHWERPVVVRGERVVSGRFDEDPDLVRGVSVVDLRMTQHVGGTLREVCVRVPVTGPGVTYWNWD
jgi:hypothetical protein